MSAKRLIWPKADADHERVLSKRLSRRASFPFRRQVQVPQRTTQPTGRIATSSQNRVATSLRSRRSLSQVSDGDREEPNQQSIGKSSVSRYPKRNRHSTGNESNENESRLPASEAKRRRSEPSKRNQSDRGSSQEADHDLNGTDEGRSKSNSQKTRELNLEKIHSKTILTPTQPIETPMSTDSNAEREREKEPTVLKPAGYYSLKNNPPTDCKIGVKSSISNSTRSQNDAIGNKPEGYWIDKSGLGRPRNIEIKEEEEEELEAPTTNTATPTLQTNATTPTGKHYQKWTTEELCAWAEGIPLDPLSVNWLREERCDGRNIDMLVNSRFSHAYQSGLKVGPYHILLTAAEELIKLHSDL